jgi:hypothetical protein
MLVFAGYNDGDNLKLMIKIISPPSCYSDLVWVVRITFDPAQNRLVKLNSPLHFFYINH